MRAEPAANTCNRVPSRARIRATTAYAPGCSPSASQQNSTAPAPAGRFKPVGRPRGRLLALQHGAAVRRVPDLDDDIVDRPRREIRDADVEGKSGANLDVTTAPAEADSGHGHASIGLRGRDPEHGASRNCAPIRSYHLRRRPIERDPALLHQDDAVAQPLDAEQIVRDEDDGLTGAAQGRDALVALALKRLVADGKRLVDQQNLRIEVRRDGETEPSGTSPRNTT